MERVNVNKKDEENGLENNVYKKIKHVHKDEVRQLRGGEERGSRDKDKGKTLEKEKIKNSE